MKWYACSKKLPKQWTGVHGYGDAKGCKCIMGWEVGLERA